MHAPRCLAAPIALTVAIWGNSPMGLNSAMHNSFLGSPDRAAPRRLASPERIKDINTGAPSTSEGYVSSRFFPVLGGSVFVAYDGRDLGLWRTDGTEEGTFLFKGTDAIVNTELAVAREELYFAVRSDSFREQIWKTNGTPEGTVLVKEFATPQPGSGPRELTSLNGLIYFWANDGTSGFELWRSDGTPEGTILVKDIFPGPGSAGGGYLTAANGSLYFTALFAEGRRGLWKSDGTSSGTVLIREIPFYPVSVQGDFRPATAGGMVYFFWSVPSSPLRLSLWRSDGTSSGTFAVGEFASDPYTGPAPGGSGLISQGPSNLTAVGRNVFFFANDGVTGRELWKSDGTPAGTRIVMDIAAGAAGSIAGSPSPPVQVGGRLYFVADDGLTGTELWASNGAVTYRVEDIAPGLKGSDPIGLASIYGRLYFSANDGSGEIHDQNFEPWISDGTAAGTYLIHDIATDSFGSYPHGFNEFRGSALFATGFGERVGLWRTDGTSAGTTFIRRIGPKNRGSHPILVADVAGKLLFGAFEDSGFPSIRTWISDGTAEGTQRLTPPEVTAFQVFEENLSAELVSNGLTLFAAEDLRGAELWKTDGTPEGTSIVRDLTPGPWSSGPTRLFAFRGEVFFFAWDPESGPVLWKSDGTESGTVEIKQIVGGYPGFLEAGESLFFPAQDDEHGQELWKTNGTPEGTVLVKDLRPGPESTYIYNPVEAGRSLFFTARFPDLGRGGLWKSDGTAAGTVPVREGFDPFGPSQLTNVQGTLFFLFSPQYPAVELWKSDGTGAGTVRVKNFEFAAVENLTSHRGMLFFTAYDESHGTELWRSDGTAQGTVVVKDIALGAQSSLPTELSVVDGTLLFAANDGGRGREIWRTDGTPEGTVLLYDIAPGPSLSWPSGFRKSGGLVYFAADDGETGQELWAFPASALSNRPSPRPVRRVPFRGP